MPYERVEDILERIRSYHREIRRCYESMAAGAQKDERLRILLDYMGRHERYFETCISRHDDSHADKMRQTWLQYVPDDQVRQVLEETTFEPSMDADEIIERGLRLDRALIAFYRGLATSLAPVRVRELFESLIELEETKGREHSKMLADLDEGQGGSQQRG